MINKATLVIIISLLTLKSFAQRDTIVNFYKTSGQKVAVLDSADFIQQIYPDTGSRLFVVRQYYKTGKLKFAGQTSKIDLMILEGTTVSYFPSGKKREVSTFTGGKKEGDAYAYYPNGQLYTHKRFTPSNDVNAPFTSNSVIVSCADSSGKILAKDGNGYYVGYDGDFKRVEEEGNLKDGVRDGKWKGDLSSKDTKWVFTEEWADGKLIGGESIVNDKEKFTYTQRDIKPQFKGGMGEFYKMVGNKMQYPQYARAYDIQGRVLITFVVNRDGYLSDYKILQSPHDVLSAEALRVLQALPKWEPGVRHGRIVRVVYTLPIMFKL